MDVPIMYNCVHQFRKIKLNFCETSGKNTDKKTFKQIP